MIPDSKNNYCVIMAGGIGSRFWPRSNKKLPKQFIDLLGTGRTLIQTTLDRFLKIVPSDHILVITNIHYESIVKEQLPELPPENILMEPAYRNTVPPVAWAAYHIRMLNPDACMVITPTDQYILNEEEFAKNIHKGLEYVSRVNHLLTIGAPAVRPETSFGYIQIDASIESGIYKVKSFTEKPEPEFARFFVDSGEFYWNTGLFIWNVNAILDAMARLIPDIGSMIERVNASSAFLEPEQKYVEMFYSSCPNISIDYGILEKSDQVDVLTCDFGWRDIGSWNALYEMAPKDRDQNVILDTKALIYDCKENLISLPPDKVVVIKDMKGYLIAEKNGILVICKRNDTAAIRQFMNDIEIRLGDKYL